MDEDSVEEDGNAEDDVDCEGYCDNAEDDDIVEEDDANVEEDDDGNAEDDVDCEGYGDNAEDDDDSVDEIDEITKDDVVAERVEVDVREVDEDGLIVVDMTVDAEENVITARPA